MTWIIAHFSSRYFCISSFSLDLVIMTLTKGKALPAIFLLMHYGTRKHSSRNFPPLVPVEIRGSREHLKQQISEAFSSSPLLFHVLRSGWVTPCLALAREAQGSFKHIWQFVVVLVVVPRRWNNPIEEFLVQKIISYRQVEVILLGLNHCCIKKRPEKFRGYHYIVNSCLYSEDR